MLAQVRARVSVTHFRAEERHMRISLTAEDVKKMDTNVPSVESKCKRNCGTIYLSIYVRLIPKKYFTIYM